MRNLELLRERIAQAPTNRRGYRLYGRELREDIKAYVASRVAQGGNYKEIAGELGLADATLMNWFKDSSANESREGALMGFRPVEVQDKQSDELDSKSDGCGPELVGGPVVVLANGIRVEGITLTELPGLLKRLGCC